MQERRAVKQLSADSLAAVPLDAIAAAQPQLHFRVSNTLRQLSFVNADVMAQAGPDGGRLAAFKRLAPGTRTANDQSSSSSSSSCDVRESSHLCRLSVDLAASIVKTVTLEDNAKGKKKGKKAGKNARRAAAEALSSAAAATEAAAVPPLVSVATFRGFDDYSSGGSGGGSSSSSSSDPAAAARTVFRSLLGAAAVHSALFPYAQHKLRHPGVGGPEASNDGGALSSAAGCFGVAPFAGVVVNHPLLEREIADFGGGGRGGGSEGSGEISSVGLASVWGTGGTLAEKITKGGRMSETQICRWLAAVAAALAALHRRGLAMGRLDAESVMLYPSKEEEDAAMAALVADARARAAQATKRGDGGGGDDDEGAMEQEQRLRPGPGPERAATWGLSGGNIVVADAVPEAKVVDLTRVAPLDPSSGRPVADYPWSSVEDVVAHESYLPPTPPQRSSSQR